MGKMYKPYTPNQFKVLAAAFRGNGSNANIECRRAKTRAVNEMCAAKLVYREFGQATELTPDGLRAYTDMCMRYDADSGCLAYAERAQEARQALRDMEGGLCGASESLSDTGSSPVSSAMENDAGKLRVQMMEEVAAARTFIDRAVSNPKTQAKLEMHAFMSIFHPEVPIEKVAAMARDADKFA